MEIQKESRNELFKRKEISVILEADKNPNFSEIKKKLSEKFSKPEDAIDVYNIKGKFGRKTFLIKAYIYDSKNYFEKAVQKTKKQREAEKKADEEAKKAAEAAKTSSAAAEEKVEERKNE